MTSVTITLDNPIMRGETEIASVEVRKPNAGQLRGLTLVDVANIKFDTMIKLLPRITSPALTEPEVTAMDLGDFTALASEVAGFLLSKAQSQDLPPQ